MIGATFGAAAVATITRAKKSIIANGNAKLDTDQAKFDHSSALFDGTGDYLTITPNPLPTSGDFTVECWFRPSAIGTLRPIWSNRDTGGTNRGVLYINSAGQITWWNGSDNLNYTGSLSANTWYHIACVKDGSTRRLFVAGGGMVTDSASYTAGDVFQIGRADYTSTAFTSEIAGHIDEFRVSNTARYTTTFTPTTSQFVNDDNTVLLLHFSGSNLSTVFEDDNGVNRSQKSLSGLGDAQIDTAQSKFGGSSLLLDGTNDRVVYGLINNTGLIPTTGQFTVEAWIRLTSTTGSKAIFAQNGDLGGAAADGNLIFAVEGNKLELTLRTGGANSIKTGTTSLVTNTWYHVALSRDSSNNFKMFLNGTQESTTLTSTQSIRSSYTAFGSLSSSDSYNFPGHIDELRVSDTARYTGNFTVPSLPFVNDTNTILLCHFDNTDGVKYFGDDNGATATTALGTAVEFDGVNDYYSATSLSTTATDSGKLLVAGTIYWTSSTNLQHVVNLRLGTGAADYGFWVWINGGRMQCKMVSGTGSNPTSIYETTENSLTSGAWNNFVIYWDTASYTTNTKIFVNGISRAVSNEGATANNWNWGNTATTIKIGEANSSQTGDGADFTGKIGQLYIHNPATFPGLEYFYQGGIRDLGIKGTATGLEQPLIYHYGDTSTFTTNNGTGFNSYTLTANGNVATSTTVPTYTYPRICSPVIGIANAQIDTAQSKIGGSSLLLDGTGDYVITNPIVWHHASTGTIEFYFRLNSTAPFAHGLFAQTTEGTTKGFQMLIVSNLLYFYKSPTTGAEVYSTTLTTGVWYHIAVVKESSSTVKIYVDGTLRYTDTSSSGQTDSAANLWFGRGMGIASGLWDGTRYDLNGWMDEIRVSKTARYTANFTAPTTPFTNDSNTILLCHFDGTDASTVFLDDNGIADHT